MSARAASRLVVAGAGGGLVGALRAAQLGAEVVVIEADPHFLRGNNTAMSTAMIPGAGSRFQVAAGVTDSPELFLSDVLAKTRREADPAVAEALGRVSARLVEWLADDMQLPIELVTDMAYPGHSVPRCHTVPGRSGANLLAMLAKRLAQYQVPLMTSTVLSGAEPAHGGVAVHAGYPDGASETIEASALLLATNGFGANAALVNEHIPEIAQATYHGSAWSRGDALRVGRSFAGSSAFMDSYQGHGALTAGARTLAGWATVMHGGIIINQQGHRFADESQGYSEFARLELMQPGGWAAIIIDQRIGELCMAFDDFRQTVDMGVVRYATSVDGLAGLLDVPAGNLAFTLSEVESIVAGVRTDPHGRTHWPTEPLRMPLAAICVQPALFHTQGGLRVDEHARVIDECGAPVRGLYASGGAAMGISGHGASGYLAGNGLLCAMGLAFLAAEHFAAQAEKAADPERA